MDVLTLRSQVAAVLTGVIGTYTLGNGSTTAAISVRKIGVGLAQGTTVSGLEVVIVQEPDLQSVSEYREPNSQELWTVYLVDWGTTVDMKAAGKKIVKGFPGSEVSTISVPEGVGPRNQLRCSIPDKQITNV
jgi:hypothetical protein